MASTNLKFFDYTPSRSSTRPQTWETSNLPEHPTGREGPTRAIADTAPNPSRNKPGHPLVDFHLFPNLPSEVQDLIWELACYGSPKAINMFLRRNMFLFVEDFPKAPTLFLVTKAARDMALKHYLQVDNAVLQRMGARPEPQQPNLAAAAPPVTGNLLLLRGLPGIREPLKLEPLRRFWINPRSDLFLLQIGKMPVLNAQAGNIVMNPMLNGFALNAPVVVPPPANPPTEVTHCYEYPFSSIAQHAAELGVSRKPAWKRIDELDLYQKTYQQPARFPDIGRLPKIFSCIHHLVLHLTLPPFLEASSTAAYATAAENVIHAFMTDVVENTLPSFPSLRHLDFYVSSTAGAPGQKASPTNGHKALLGCNRTRYSPQDVSLDGTRYYIKDYRKAPIVDSDGVSFGGIELGLLEREFTIAFLDKARREGKKPHEAMSNNIVVAVPWYADRMDYGLDSGNVVDNAVGFEMRDTAAIDYDDEGVDVEKMRDGSGGFIDERIDDLVAGLSTDDSNNVMDADFFDGDGSEDFDGGINEDY